MLVSEFVICTAQHLNGPELWAVLTLWWIISQHTTLLEPILCFHCNFSDFIHLNALYLHKELTTAIGPHPKTVQFILQQNDPVHKKMLPSSTSYYVGPQTSLSTGIFHKNFIHLLSLMHAMCLVHSFLLDLVTLHAEYKTLHFLPCNSDLSCSA